MRSRRSILLAGVLTLGLLPASPALAQGRRGMGMGRRAPARPARPEKAPNTPVDEFEGMSEQERQKALNRLPPQQRKKLEERLQEFKKLPPEQQQALRNLYGRLHGLPAERQEVVRKSINQFFQAAPDRRQAMREELRGIGLLAAPDRQARMESPDFRGKFDPKEQEIIRDMSDLLPPRS